MRQSRHVACRPTGPPSATRCQAGRAPRRREPRDRSREAIGEYVARANIACGLDHARARRIARTLPWISDPSDPMFHSRTAVFSAHCSRAAGRFCRLQRAAAAGARLFGGQTRNETRVKHDVHPPFAFDSQPHAARTRRAAYKPAEAVSGKGMSGANARELSRPVPGRLSRAMIDVRTVSGDHVGVSSLRTQMPPPTAAESRSDRAARAPNGLGRAPDFAADSREHFERRRSGRIFRQITHAAVRGGAAQCPCRRVGDH